MPREIVRISLREREHARRADVESAMETWISRLCLLFQLLTDKVGDIANAGNAS